MNERNRQILLAARPQGLPIASDWELREQPVPRPGEGECVVEVRYLSLDPAMRGWMNEGRSYVPPVEIGAVMRAGGIGRVTASNNSELPVGTWVSGMLGVQEYTLSDGSGLTRVDPDAAPLPKYLSALGMTGMTAYFGLLEIGRPQPGQTVVVSAAAGAVGSVVGQIAKLKGCRAVGIAGGPEKCRSLVDDYGFDAAVDYKAGDVTAALREKAPDGIDVYFDNVGGDILDAALANLARGARVVICGAISQYNAEGGPKGPANYMSLLVNRASMTGMVVFDFASRYGEAAADMAKWLSEGRIRTHEDIVAGGVETFPDVLLRLFRGENKGKLILGLKG